MKSGSLSDSSAASYPQGVSAPKFHLFQSVTIHAEGTAYPADCGRIIGVAFDPQAHLESYWWYEVDYPGGCASSPWLQPGHREQIPESDITQRA